MVVPMTSPMQSLSLWDSLSVNEQRREARSLVSHLSAGWTFREIGSYILGGQQHRIAVFSWHRMRFALIPGGPLSLDTIASSPPIQLRAGTLIQCARHRHTVTNLPTSWTSTARHSGTSR